MATARKLPSGSWRVRVYDKDTDKYKSFTAKTKKAAEKMAADWLIEREIGQECGLTFQAAAEAYIADKAPTLSPTTIEGYRVIVRNNTKRFNDTRLSAITPRDVQDWVNELTVSKTPKTVRNVYGFFKAVLLYHDIEINLRKITLPQKVRKFKRLPPAELVIETFRGTDIELPVLLALWCGLRMSEILGIQARDIQDGVLTISRVKVKAGNETYVKERAKTYTSNRQIALPPPLLELVKATGKTGMEFLIDYSRSQIFERYVWQMRKLGYEVNFHDLRHVNASVMAALGIPDIYAMERGGWSKATTMKQVYQQTFSDERRRYDTVIDGYFSELYATKHDTENEENA